MGRQVWPWHHQACPVEIRVAELGEEMQGALGACYRGASLIGGEALAQATFHWPG